MRKKITILFFIILFLGTSCGIAKPNNSTSINNQEQTYKQDEKVLKGLLFGLVTYALYSIISNH